MSDIINVIFCVALIVFVVLYVLIRNYIDREIRNIYAAINEVNDTLSKLWEKVETIHLDIYKNKIKEEGDWDKWSRELPNKFLEKQSMTYDDDRK